MKPPVGGHAPMKTDIYYFSATGNSLWIARKIAEKIEDAELISIPAVIDQAPGITGEVIGIVCPIYMYNVPHIVADFIGKIAGAEYVFFVYAGAGETGNGIRAVTKLFESRELPLQAIFNVPMPSNYTPYGCPSKEKQQKLFAEAGARIDEIAGIVRDRRSFTDSTNTSFFGAHIHPGIFYRMGYSHIPELDKSYVTDGNCTGCGICEKVCPVGNITMKDGIPEWNHRCQLCYACLQWCPSGAIQAGDRTVGIERYHNPNVTVKDIIGASGRSVH